MNKSETYKGMLSGVDKLHSLWQVQQLRELSNVPEALFNQEGGHGRGSTEHKELKKPF